MDETSKKTSDKVSVVKYSSKTPVCIIEELSFSKDGEKFAGWKVFREVDDTWDLVDKKTNEKGWYKLVDG